MGWATLSLRLRRKEMKDSKKVRRRFKYWAAYTLLFAVACLGIFIPFIQANKSFMWKTDGLFQTFSSMVFISDYYKSIISGFLHGNFYPEMINFNIGLGYDVFTTLNYYGLGDPLLFFSVFFNKENIYIFYNILVIIRLYLCGIGFILYCGKMDKGNKQSLIGAIIYVFSGFAVVAGVKHPYFLNAMIYLPFLLIGVETILKKKKSYLFTIMILISVVSNYYFFYMLTIMVFLYALIRFIDRYRREWKANILNILIRGVVQYLLGILLSCFAFVPTIYAFMNNARGTKGAYNGGLIYYMRYYYNLFFSFFSVPSDINGNYTFLAYAPICFFIVVFLYLYKENFKKYMALKSGYALATIMLLTPIGGYIMNGMSYTSNRWVFGYSFFTAFAVVCLLDDFLKVTIKRLIPLAGLSLILMGGLVVVESDKMISFGLGVVFLNIMIAALIAITRFRTTYIKYGVVLLVTLMAVITFGFYQNSPYGKNYSNEFRENGKAISMIEDCPQSSVDYEEDKGFYRIGSYGNWVENQSLTMGFNGTASYYSLLDANILKYMLDNEITTIRQPHRFYGLDFRTYLDTLASVKYYAFEAGSIQEKAMPYGYQEINRKLRKNSDVTDVVYKNQYTLPLGYTYDKKISTAYYDTLSSIEKQQAMMQAVVVDKPDNDSQDAMKYSEEKLNYQIEEENGITWNKELNTIKIDNDTSTITVTFNAKKNSETYLRFVGLDIENSRKAHFTAKITTSQANSKLNLTNSKYSWDLQRENYLVNLGHNNEGETLCTISFASPGEYELKDIEVYSLSMTDYEEQVKKLSEEVLTNIQLTNNKITGNVEVSNDKSLCFSLLYSTGWKVKIDGQEATLYKANTMYMATDITKGAHTIELIYQTPGLKTGVIISLITVLGLAIIVIIGHLRKKKRK